MSGRQSLLAWGAVAIIAGGGIWLTAGNAQPDSAADVAKSPAELLPANPVLFGTFDGSKEHAAEFKKTAAYKAMYESGLVEVLVKAINGFGKQAGREFAIAKKALGHLLDHGMSLAVSLTPSRRGPPLINGVIVLHDGAKLEPELAALVRQATQGAVKWETVRTAGRTITSTRIPETPVEIGWWTEGRHLMIAAGMNAVQSALAVANGKAKNITSNPLYKQYRKSDGFTVTSLGWIDVPQVVNAVSKIPIPAPGREIPGTVGDVLKVLGVDTAGPLVSRSGIDGKALVTETNWKQNGKPRGIFAMTDGKPLSLKELPPLPGRISMLAAGAMDFPNLYENVTGMIQGIAKLGPPDAIREVNQVLDALPDMLGFDPNKDFCDALGRVAAVYADDGLEFGMALAVKDQDRVAKSMDRVMQLIANEVGERNFRPKKTAFRGRTIVTMEIGGGFLNPAYVVDKDWLVIGLVPQVAKAHILRADGKLPTWKPSDAVAESLAKLPKNFSSIAISDPAPFYRAAMSVAPFALGPVKSVLRRQFGPNFDFPLDVADLPPAEAVAGPLFPNVAVGVMEKDGIRWMSRNSAPQILDIKTMPVLIGLLLPAVQKAREAARRTQVRDHLHNIGVAVHNYAEAYDEKLPPGVIANKNLKPDERLSWIVAILPFIEQKNIWERMDRKKGWKDKANRKFLSARIKMLLNPSYTRQAIGFKDKDGGYTLGVSNFVGITGYGKDSHLPTTPVKRRGVFGIDRSVTLTQITNGDGTSLTGMVVESTEKSSPPWGAGRMALRGFSKKPYVNGPDGIGYSAGSDFSMLFCDGSVRRLSNTIHPKVLEALSTYAGNERLGDP